MFCTAYNYVSLRLLGEGPDGGEDNAMASGRKWIFDHGGVTNIPSWGKTWLSVLWPFSSARAKAHGYICMRLYNFWSEPISSYVGTWCLWLVWMQTSTSGVLDASFFSTHTSRFAKFKFYLFLRLENNKFVWTTFEDIRPTDELLHKGYDGCVNNVHVLLEDWQSNSNRHRWLH